MMVVLAMIHWLTGHSRLILGLNSLVNLVMLAGMTIRPPLSPHLNEENLVNYTHQILLIIYLF